MSDATMTLVVNGNAYKLSATDPDSLKAITPNDRKALLALLEALKRSDQAAGRALEQAVAVAHQAQAASPTGAAPAQNAEPVKAERMGSGDVDALMARLIAEDQQSRKPVPNQRSVMKGFAVIAVVVLLMVIIF